jgi:hypothetical protein
MKTTKPKTKKIFVLKTTKPKTKRIFVRKSEYDEGKVWCHVIREDSTVGLCGHPVDTTVTALPDEEVPDEITCPDCLTLIAAMKILGIELPK